MLTHAWLERKKRRGEAVPAPGGGASEYRLAQLQPLSPQGLRPGQLRVFRGWLRQQLPTVITRRAQLLLHAPDLTRA